MLPLLPFGPFSAGTFILLLWNAWLAILHTALFCWVIPCYLWLRGLKHISPVTSSVVLLTEIVVAVSISTIFLGGALTVISSFGAIFIVVAMLLVSQADPRENNASTIA
jgi:drug/metabolite transporter (DMT)-like permease